jgi:tagatose 6-phosphate kinase
MGDNSFLTVCLNPTLQKTFVLKQLLENEVNRSKEHYLDASGKGINVSRVLTQLGAQVIHLTQAGGRNRELFLDLAAKDQIQCQWVESQTEIRFCYTLLNQEKHTTTEVIEEAEPTGADTEERIYQAYQKLLPSCRTVIISGTKAPGFSAELYPNMVRDAKAMGKTVILDLKGSDLVKALPYRPDIIKPNFSEFCDTFYQEGSVSEHEVQQEMAERVKEKMVALFEQCGVISVLTRGKYGALVVSQGRVVSIPAEIFEPVNTIGCGDAFTAGLAFLWQPEQDITKAIRKGMDCAKLNALSVHPGNIR